MERIILSQPIKKGEEEALIKMMSHLNWFYRLGLRETAQITYPAFNTSERFGDVMEVVEV